MPELIPSVFNWSGGKDATLSLHHVLANKTYAVKQLLTTLSDATRRVSMHGVRQELLHQQAAAVGIPFREVFLPAQASMQAYNAIMRKEMQACKEVGMTHAIYGDINLEDLRTYREEELAKAGMQAVFPLWNRPTHQLVREFLQLGYKAMVVCVNARLLDASFAGRILDEQFLEDLPPEADPAGENGEFHTFVFDGPIFRRPVLYTLGETVRKSYAPTTNPKDNCFQDEKKPTFDQDFIFRDLLPA
ncbi:Dph6-related ATP pyrophosphatase [Pontibacter sp. CAU 1760]